MDTEELHPWSAEEQVPQLASPAWSPEMSYSQAAPAQATQALRPKKSGRKILLIMLALAVMFGGSIAGAFGIAAYMRHDQVAQRDATTQLTSADRTPLNDTSKA